MLTQPKPLLATVMNSESSANSSDLVCSPLTGSKSSQFEMNNWSEDAWVCAGFLWLPLHPSKPSSQLGGPLLQSPGTEGPLIKPQRSGAKPNLPACPPCRSQE